LPNKGQPAFKIAIFSYLELLKSQPVGKTNFKPENSGGLANAEY
jgi:hypothetical protein